MRKIVIALFVTCLIFAVCAQDENIEQEQQAMSKDLILNQKETDEKVKTDVTYAPQMASIAGGMQLPFKDGISLQFDGYLSLGTLSAVVLKDKSKSFVNVHLDSAISGSTNDLIELDSPSISAYMKNISCEKEPIKFRCNGYVLASHTKDIGAQYFDVGKLKYQVRKIKDFQHSLTELMIASLQVSKILSDNVPDHLKLQGGFYRDDIKSKEGNEDKKQVAYGAKAEVELLLAADMKHVLGVFEGKVVAYIPISEWDESHPETSPIITGKARAKFIKKTDGNIGPFISIEGQKSMMSGEDENRGVLSLGVDM